MTERLGIPGEIALWCAWLLTSLLIAAGAMISFGCSGWACELLSHFPAQLAAAALVTSVTFAVVGRIRCIVIPAAVAAWNIGALGLSFAKTTSASAWRTDRPQEAEGLVGRQRLSAFSGRRLDLVGRGFPKGEDGRRPEGRREAAGVYALVAVKIGGCGAETTPPGGCSDDAGHRLLSRETERSAKSMPSFRAHRGFSAHPIRDSSRPFF